MNTGSVNFSAKTSGLMVDEFSTESGHPSIDSLSCSINEDEIVNITVELIDVYAEGWPDSTIVEEVQQFIDVLSFEFDSPISSLRHSGHSLKKDDGSGLSQVSASFASLWDIAEATLKPGSHSLSQFKKRFKDHRLSSSMRLYSSAIQQEDPIARFMFLYNIILTLSGDLQATVDSNILEVSPDTPITVSPFKTDIEETLYTRLRNEIAHNRVGAEFGATSNEVRSSVQGLGKIVKELILKNG